MDMMDYLFPKHRPLEELPATGERIDMPALPEPLQAVSNVIELKPGKKYFFLFKRLLTKQEIAEIERRINDFGIQALVCGADADVEIIEAPEEVKSCLTL